MKYPITNFSKGLVDESSEAKFTEDYRQKCSILDNFYVHKNKTIRKRPPLTLDTTLPPGTVDFIRLEEGLVVMRKIETPTECTSDGNCIVDGSRLNSELLDFFRIALPQESGGDALHNPGMRTFNTGDNFNIRVALDLTSELNLHILEIYNNENEITNSYLFFINQDTSTDIQTLERYPLAAPTKSPIFDNIETAIQNLRGINVEYYFHSIKDKINISFNEWTNRISKSSGQEDEFRTNISQQQLTKNEVVPIIENSDPTLLMGIFQGWKEGETLISHTSRTKPINLGASDNEEESFKWWAGEQRSLFITKSLCNDFNTIINNQYTLEKSRTNNNIELTFAGMRYKLIDGKLTNIHSQLSLMPSSEQLDDGGTLIETDRKMHNLSDFPIKVIEVNLTNGLPLYSGERGIETDPDIAGTERGLWWGPPGLQRIFKQGEPSTEGEPPSSSSSDLTAVQRYRPSRPNNEGKYFLNYAGRLNNDSFDTTNASEIKLYNTLNEFINTNLEMYPLLNLLRPTITDYVPFRYTDNTFGAQQHSGTKSTKPGIRYLVPDIKLTKTGTDHQPLKRTRATVERTPNRLGRRPEEVFYAALDLRIDIDANAAIPATVLSNFLFSYTEGAIEYHVFWENTRATNLDPLSSNATENNIDNFATPGIVLHVQTGNIKDEDDNPIYNPYGNLNQGLGSERFDFAANADNNNIDIFNDSKFKPPKTVKTFYLTYDYGSKEILNYFNNIQAISSIANYGKTIKPITLIKDTSKTIQNISNTYITDLIKNLTFYKLYPKVDATLPNKVSWDDDDVTSNHYVFNNAGDNIGSYIGFVLMPIVLPAYFINLCTGFNTAARNIPQNNVYKHTYDITGNADVRGNNTLWRRYVSVTDDPDVEKRYYDFYLKYLALRFGATKKTGFFVASDSADELEIIQANRALKDLIPQMYGRSDALGGYLEAIEGIAGGPNWADPYAMRPAPIVVYHSPTFPQVTFQRFFSKPTRSLLNTNVSEKENILNISGREDILRPGFKERFSNPIANYLSAFTNTNPLNAKVFQDSNVSTFEQSLTDKEPRQFNFFSKQGFKENILDVISESVSTIIIGLTNSIRQFVGAFTQQERFASAGTSSNIELESRFIIHASDKNIHQTKYIEEARGWITDTINEEFQDIDEIDGVANLFSAHRLFFFYKKGQKTLFCLTMGRNRDILGFSKLNLRTNIDLIKAISKDELQILSGSRIYKMDFTAGKDTIYEDDTLDSNGNRNGAWETRMASLPIFLLTDTESSLFEAISVTRAVISYYGFAEFDIELLNEDGTLRASRSYRENVRNNITEVKQQSGPILIDSIPNNAGKPPRFSIVNSNNKYLSIASAVLDLGRTRGTYARK